MSRRNGAALVASGVVYTAGIVTASKQYARYLLPLLPLAALALGAVAEDLVRSLKHWYHRQRRRMPRLVPSALGLEVHGVTRRHEGSDVCDGVVDEEAVPVTGDVQGLVEVLRARRVDGDEGQVGPVDLGQPR